MRNKRGRENDDDDDDDEEEKDKPANVKKVKVQLQNVDNITDIRQKERNQINNSIGEQHKVEAITYPHNSTMQCGKCGKEFSSLKEFNEHRNRC